MMLHTAARIQTLAPYYFATLETRIAGMQAAGQDIIRLDAGSPDLPPAPHILEALVQTARLPTVHGYQSLRGTPGLRCAWAEMYRHTYHTQLDPEREILPLMGSKEGIFNLTLACIEPGEVVLGPDPGYMTYARAATFAGGEYYPLSLLPENHYLPDLQAIPAEILECSRMLWINYPHNPTAATASIEFLRQAVGFAYQHHLLLCSDAAYSQVAFDGYQAPSLMSLPGAKEVAVEFNSLSKSHNMAGWRQGVAVGIPAAIEALFRVNANGDSGHFLPVIQAAVTALTGDQSWLVRRNKIYQERRDVVVKALHQVGMNCATPQASLYIWAPVPAGWTSADFTALLLEKAGVSLTPGTVFGKHGEGFARLSLTQPVERMKEAMQRLILFVGGL